MRRRHLIGAVLLATVSLVCLSAVAGARRTDRSESSESRAFVPGNGGRTGVVSSKLAAPHAHATQQGHEHKFQMTVDGAKQPDLIPDAYAYHHLLVATAVSDAQTPKHRAWITARIKRIGFSDEDRARYEQTLEKLGLAKELSRINAQRKIAGTQARQGLQDAAASLRTLLAQERAAIGAAKTSIESSLSSQGKVLFDKQIDEVKRQVKVYSVIGGL